MNALALTIVMVAAIAVLAVLTGHAGPAANHAQYYAPVWGRQ